MASNKQLNNPLGGLYRLNYMRANIQQFMLIRFSTELKDINEAVKWSKRYCNANNLRFVFIEPAIATIDLTDLENIIDE